MGHHLAGKVMYLGILKDDNEHSRGKSTQFLKTVCQDNNHRKNGCGLGFHNFWVWVQNTSLDLWYLCVSLVGLGLFLGDVRLTLQKASFHWKPLFLDLTGVTHGSSVSWCLRQRPNPPNAEMCVVSTRSDTLTHGWLGNFRGLTGPLRWENFNWQMSNGANGQPTHRLRTGKPSISIQNRLQQGFCWMLKTREYYMRVS